MGNPSRSRDRAVDASVDLVAVQHSVEALMAGIGPAGPGFSVRPLSAGLAELISAATQILGVDRIGVMLLDEHDHLRSVAGSDSPAAAIEDLQERTGIGPGVDTVRNGETVTVADLLDDERYPQLAELLETSTVRAVVSAPIRANGVIAGNFNAVRSLPHGWLLAEIAAIEKYAQVVGALLALNASAVRVLLTPEGGSTRTSDGRMVG